MASNENTYAKLILEQKFSPAVQVLNQVFNTKVNSDDFTIAPKQELTGDGEPQYTISITAKNASQNAYNALVNVAEQFKAIMPKTFVDKAPGTVVIEKAAGIGTIRLSSASPTLLLESLKTLVSKHGTAFTNQMSDDQAAVFQNAVDQLFHAGKTSNV